MLQCLMHKGLHREAVLKLNIFGITKVIILSSALFLAGGCAWDGAVGFDEQEIILSEQQLNIDNEEGMKAVPEYAEGASDRGVYPDEANAVTAAAVTDTKVHTTVTVYVCGAVVCPGVYTLEEGARIVDAVKMAGGMDAGADNNYVNQAMPLTDGQKIYIPLKSETEGMAFAQEAESGMYGDADRSVSAEGTTSGISLNRATEEELMTLPGIGRAKAALIIEYREQNGGFAAIEDIMKISGIKEGMFNKIKDKITI